MEFTIWNQVFQALLTAIAPVLAGGVVLLIKKAFAFIETKTDAIKDEQIRQGLLAAESEAERLTITIVSSLNQTVVNGLKEQNGSKLSPADAVRIRDEALSAIYSLLSDEAKSILINHKTDIYAYMKHLLEETVGNLKSDVVTLKRA